MPIITPQPAFDFVIIDYLSDLTVATRPATSTGILDAVFDVVETPYYWLVDRITVETNSSLPTALVVYAGDPAQRNVRDSTSSGNADVADESAPIVVPTGQHLHLRWTGASLGAVGTANMQARIVQRTPPGARS